MRVLVTGAAGYVGSVVTEQLVEEGHDVVALDNLCQGHRAAVHPGARFVHADLADGAWLTAFLVGAKLDAVVHLAAESLVEASMRDPGLVFRVNVAAGLTLLHAMVTAGISRIVFSSTAAVYGEAADVPITEETPCQPVNPYGESKLAFERMLAWYRRAHGLNTVALRYFNACGATARCGERHAPETHLIPILLDVALGRQRAIHLYGTEYDTPDGTCVRDYVHVADIAAAHVLALRAVGAGGPVFNLGTGTGYSNRQVIDAVCAVTGRPIAVEPAPRRPGDPPRLVASSDRLRRALGWQPRYRELPTMVETAWAWRLKHPDGYDA